MGNPFGAATGKLQLRGIAGFPALARQAEPAQDDPTQDLDTPRSDRRIANVAWLTVTDAIYRLPHMTGTTGRGLRGGGYTVTTTPTGTRIDYHNTQFTNDVYLSGQVTLDTTNTLTGRVTLIGPRDAPAPSPSTQSYGTRPTRWPRYGAPWLAGPAPYSPRPDDQTPVGTPDRRGPSFAGGAAKARAVVDDQYPNTHDPNVADSIPAPNEATPHHARTVPNHRGSTGQGVLRPKSPAVSAHVGKPHFVGGFPDSKIPARTRLSPPVSIGL
jgi:hypothetical protein